MAYALSSRLTGKHTGCHDRPRSSDTRSCTWLLAYSSEDLSQSEVTALGVNPRVHWINPRVSWGSIHGSVGSISRGHRREHLSRSAGPLGQSTGQVVQSMGQLGVNPRVSWGSIRGSIGSIHGGYRRKHLSKSTGQLGQSTEVAAVKTWLQSAGQSGRDDTKTKQMRNDQAEQRRGDIVVVATQRAS
eukprot:1196301-Prorocentrum_minimum.AAC.6